MEKLKERLLKRGTEDFQSIERRMEIARIEIDYQKYYDCIIVNNNYNETLKNLKEVLLSVSKGN